MAAYRFPCSRTTPTYTATYLTRTAISRREGAIRIAFVGDLDAGTADYFIQETLRTLDLSHEPLVEIDLSEVGFLAAAGVRALIDCHRAANAQHRKLTVRNPQPLTRLVLQITAAFDLLVDT